ncbi:hypothetical protein CAEBREN_10647 [Caenorhabditis brenneri]|uniref:Lipoprotein n=1 Tax=Caenorhabditis brenneri TaxID=135651 RepID=G0MAQ9_CAEBE|nr:hypothetical protein CAEBREN_10647 [Caenorhabditis brenneri]
MKLRTLFVFCAILVSACYAGIIQGHSPLSSQLQPHYGFFPGIGVVADSPENTVIIDSSLRIVNPRFRNILVR